MPMSRCITAACAGTALAPWWLLCPSCTLLLEKPAGSLPTALGDQAAMSGWDAVTWAERIAPSRWGQANESDRWVMRLRALTLAETVTARTAPCPHTTGRDSAVPVVVPVRAPLVLACPPCAEPSVAATTTDGHACDRCAGAAVTTRDRSALLVGQSLILVAQLCAPCAAAAFEDHDVLTQP